MINIFNNIKPRNQVLPCFLSFHTKLVSILNIIYVNISDVRVRDSDFGIRVLGNFFLFICYFI